MTEGGVRKTFLSDEVEIHNLRIGSSTMIVKEKTWGVVYSAISMPV